MTKKQKIALIFGPLGRGLVMLCAEQGYKVLADMMQKYPKCKVSYLPKEIW